MEVMCAIPGMTHTPPSHVLHAVIYSRQGMAMMKATLETVLRIVELPSISLRTMLTVDREQLAGAIRHKRNKLIFVTWKFLGLFILAV